MSWIKKLFAKNDEKSNSHFVGNGINENMDEIRQVGSQDGRHYTDSVETVKRLKREGRHEDAINVLLQAIESTEKESDFAGEGWGVAPWYYEQLAIIYRREKEYQKEVEILERYAAQPKSPGVGPQKLAERLAKAKELLANQNKT